MAIEKNMPESPITEEQNRASSTGLATAVAEKPSTEDLESSKTSKDKKDSEQKQVELEFKVFQADKDKEIAKKAKKLAKDRFNELQNTSSQLTLSKLEQSFVKMLAPDLFAYIDSESGNLLGTLSTSKKQDPYESYTHKRPGIETIKTENLDGKDFIVTYDALGNQTSMELLDVEYVEPERAEVSIETKTPSVPEGSRTQLMQSLAQELGLRSKYYDVVEKDGKYVAVINKDKVLDALNNKEIDLATVKEILEQNNEHFSGETPVTPEPQTKATQHDLAQAIQTGFFGAEKVLKYRTNNQGFLEIELLDENTGKTRFISSESAQQEQVAPVENGSKRKVYTPEEAKALREQLIANQPSDQENLDYLSNLPVQYLIDPETGQVALDRKGRPIPALIGGAFVPTPPTPPPPPTPPSPPAPPGGEPPEPIFTTNGNTFRSIDPRTGRVLSESGFRDTMADRGTDIPGVIDDTEVRERVINELVGNGGYSVEDARKKAAEMHAQAILNRQFGQREASTREAQNLHESINFSQEWKVPGAAQNLYEQERRKNPNLPPVEQVDPRAAYLLVKQARGLPMVIQDWEQAEAMSPFAGGRMPEAQENKEFSGRIQQFDKLYATIFPGKKQPEHVKSLKDLSDEEKDYFLHHLPSGFDMNTVIKRIIANPESNRYPGQDLAIILKADQEMGLDGALVRRRVEQLIAFEEFDEDKQMREGNIGTLIQGIGQFLSAAPELQHALRVEVSTRFKLHETTIIARYLGVDKLADQMSNFYQDEFNVIMNTRLFRESSMMLETEDGAYFRKGRGFDTPEEEHRHKKSGRYDENTMKMALLLMPNLSESEWKDIKFTREAAMEVARRFVENSNLLERYKEENKAGGQGKEIADLDKVMDEIIKEGKHGLTADQKASLEKFMLERSTMSRLFSSGVDPKTNLENVYKILKRGFDQKQKGDERIGGASSMGDAVDELARAGEKSGDPLFTRLFHREKKDEKGEVMKDQNGNPMMEEVRRALTEHEKQDLIDVFNEANRAFGLSKRMADIYGTATRYDGLLDKSGKLIKPKAILEFPKDLNWKHIYRFEKDEDENDNARFHLAIHLPGFLDRLKKDNPRLAVSFDAVKQGNWKNIPEKEKDRVKKEISDYMNIYLRDTKMQEEAQKLLDGYVKEYQGLKIDLTKKLDKLTDKEKKALHIVRELEFKAIRDTQTKAIREMIVDNWDNIDFDASTRGTASKEYKKAMWNQIQLMGFNKDTKGKEFLRKYASTEIVALNDDNARCSVLEQMKHWGDDFQNMKKHNEELKVGSALRKALIEAEPGLFNSTSKLNDPIDSLKQIKDKYLTDWTQGHRVDYMNFLAEGVLLYIAKYNKENDGYKNTGVVREMNLMHAMVINSIITKPEKRKVEKKLYGGHQIAHIRYGLKKGHWLQGIFEFLGEIFKESAKGLTK